MESDEAIGKLVAALSDSNYLNRANAARELVNLKSAATGALPHLLALRSDPSYLVRVQIPRATIHLGAAPEQALPILWELLEDEEEIVSRYAVWALERFGQGSEAEIIARRKRPRRQKPPQRIPPGSVRYLPSSGAL